MSTRVLTGLGDGEVQREYVPGQTTGAGDVTSGTGAGTTQHNDTRRRQTVAPSHGPYEHPQGNASQLSPLVTLGTPRVTNVLVEVLRIPLRLPTF